MPMTRVVDIIIIISLAIPGSNTNGFGISSCTDMKPAGIKEPAQGSQPPYVISVSPNQYEDGIPMTVMIESVDISVFFTAFILEARCVTCADTTTPVGTFTNIPKGAVVLECSSTKASVTSSNTDPRNSFSVTWIPPSNFTEIVIMRASVVQSSYRWWTIQSLALGNKGTKLGTLDAVPILITTTAPSSAPRLRTDVSLVLYATFGVLLGLTLSTNYRYCVIAFNKSYI